MMSTNDDIINDYKTHYNVNQLMAKYHLSRHTINEILLNFREEVYLDYLSCYNYELIAKRYGIPVKKIHSIVRGRSHANEDIAQPRIWQHTQWGVGDDEELISQIKYNIQGSIDMVKMILRKNPHLLSNNVVQDLLYHAGIKY